MLSLNVDLLKGRILRSLIIFAIPLFISSVFQQLYNTVDVMIVGNYLGDTSLAAIGASAAVYELLVGFSLGVGNGLSIVTARSFGSNNEEEVKKKFVAMVKKLSPDVVVCGPALHYPNFGEMAGGLAEEINNNSGIPAFAAISVENPGTEKYKDRVIVVKTPKKGGIGLNESIENICKMAIKLANNENVDELKNKVCF